MTAAPLRSRAQTYCYPQGLWKAQKNLAAKYETVCAQIMDRYNLMIVVARQILKAINVGGIAIFLGVEVQLGIRARPKGLTLGIL
jgi:hypothetical protein